MQLPRLKSTETSTVCAFASSEFLASSTITPFKWVIDVEDLILATTSGGSCRIPVSEDMTQRSYKVDVQVISIA
jgi:predicted nucleic acid-binding protein